MSIHQRVLSTWSQQFGIDTAKLREPGTTLLERPNAEPTAWLTLWPAGERIIVEVPTALLSDVRAILAARPDDHQLSAADLAEAWSDARYETQQLNINVAAGESVTSVEPAAPGVVRGVDNTDRDAFDALKQRCAPAEVEAGAVDVSDEVASAVLVGDQVVAAASMFGFYGFADIGVLVDPGWRQRGYGSAVVSHLCRQLVCDERVLLYRHDVRNLGSAAVASRLGFTYLATVDTARRLDPS